jgi:hypothetical protein
MDQISAKEDNSVQGKEEELKLPQPGEEAWLK